MSTLPAIQPHTTAKHDILRYHMNAWFPILSVHGCLQYIDGFSGSGEYREGEPGSPIIVLDAVKRHQRFASFAQEGKIIEFLFVDTNLEYCRHLQRKIDESSWPSAFKVEVVNGEFEDVLNHRMDDVTTRGRQMPPTLAFVDPFGPAGFSMDLLRRIAAFDRVDALINLNHLEFVRWILEDPSKHVTANRLYGGTRWRPALDKVGRARTAFLTGEYEKALEEIGWRGTSFEMVNRQNQTAYHLVFGTGSSKGMEAIKLAMRNVSPSGEFRYTDRIDPAQPVLLGLNMANEYPTEIGEYLFQKYEDQEVAFDLLMEDEIDWHRWWLPTDLRKGLTYLEYGEWPRITNVRNGDGRPRRRDSYPEGCFITFGSPSQVQGRLL